MQDKGDLKNTSDLSVTDRSTTTSHLIRQKIVFVGDVAVGKTSIISRFVENKFKDTYDVYSL